MIIRDIESLLTYGLFHKFYTNEDVDAVRGKLCEYLNVPLYDAGELQDAEQGNKSEGLADGADQGTDTDLEKILARITDWAFESGMIKSNHPPYSDNFDTALMGILCPMPSEVSRRFKELYAASPKSATDWYYSFSKETNYIRMSRMTKNVVWQQPTAYGDMVMTINLSKPEKDPKAIAEAANLKETNFPKCLLCAENVGYAGTVNQPARQNHRVIPLTLANEPWILQYSPYIYYNEHAIVINKKHTPMVINRDTFVRLCEFVTHLDHYFIGSNADLPLVGGSMLTHDHYQAGCYDMPMAKAEAFKAYELNGFDQVKVTWLNWPLTVLRLSGKSAEEVIALADKITTVWRGYTSEVDELFSHTGSEAHHTVTPIVRKNLGNFEIDVVLRDNRRSEQYPDGIYHPHVEIHPVKKENIGLIEVMGLAVLPSRLKETAECLADGLAEQKSWGDIVANPLVAGFEAIYGRMLATYQTGKSAMSHVQDVIGQVFVEGLEHSGVMPISDCGEKAMERFIAAVNQGV